LPLCSRRGFCSHGAVLGTPVLRYNRCATPAKLPFCKCPVRLQIPGRTTPPKRRRRARESSKCVTEDYRTGALHRQIRSDSRRNACGSPTPLQVLPQQGRPLRDYGIPRRRSTDRSRLTANGPAVRTFTPHHRRAKTTPSIFGNKHSKAMPLYSKSAKSSSSGVSWSYNVLPLTIFTMPTR